MDLEKILDYLSVSSTVLFVISEILPFTKLIRANSIIQLVLSGVRILSGVLSVQLFFKKRKEAQKYERSVRSNRKEDR